MVRQRSLPFVSFSGAAGYPFVVVMVQVLEEDERRMGYGGYMHRGGWGLAWLICICLDQCAQ